MSRLEMAALVASSLPGSDNAVPKLQEVADAVKSCLPLRGYYGRMQDPPERLFTENVIFHGGNHVIYPGTSDVDSYVVQVLAKAIYSERPHDVYTAITCQGIQAMLDLSSAVAQRAGHTRYMDLEDQWAKDLICPPLADAERLTRAVSWTKADISEITDKKRLHGDVFEPFLIDAGAISSFPEDPSCNPLYIRPLVIDQDEVIVAAPGAFASALRHWIWLLAIRNGQAESFSKYYRDTMWLKAQRNLRLMSYRCEQVPLQDLPSMLPARDGVFRIDSDKLAYVLLLTDPLADYCLEEPFGYWSSKRSAAALRERIGLAVKTLTESREAQCATVLVLLLLGSVGRGIRVDPGSAPARSRLLVLTDDELATLAFTYPRDELTLWKYAGAKEHLGHETRLLSWSMLDTFAIYRDHEDSLYCGDESQFHLMITVPPGSGRHVRVRAMQEHDEHAEKGGDPPSYISVVRDAPEPGCSIYVPVALGGLSLQRVLTGFPMPLWIGSEKLPGAMRSDVCEVAYWILETLSYWLSQMKEDIAPLLRALGPEPVHISFELRDENRWTTDSKEPLDSAEAPAFEFAASGRTCLITVPPELRAHMLGTSGAGERALVAAALEALSSLCTDAGETSLSTPEIRWQLVNGLIKDGPRRKFFVVAEERSALRSTGVSKPRHLQKHDFQEMLDGILHSLGENPPAAKKDVPQAECTKLCERVVDIYIERLRGLLRDLAWRPLLEYLIGNYEALLHSRLTRRITRTTQAACHGADDETTELFLTEQVRDTETALATRILVEFVSAELPVGLMPVSRDRADQLVACAFQVFYWGTVSDSLHFRLAPTRLSLLPSGRVGRHDTSSWEDSMRTYYEAKLAEQMRAEAKAFARGSEVKRQEPGETEKTMALDRAFAAEFGVSATALRPFWEFLMNLGFKLGGACAVYPAGRLRDEISASLGWPTSQVDAVISRFSLSQRARWDIPPEGYQLRDIEPWKYKRRLSYVLRPLVVVSENDTEPEVLWGPRQAEEASHYLLDLVASGRYPAMSSGMRRYSARRNKETGDEFLNRALSWFSNNSAWQCHPKVTIKPHGILEADKDLGDVDILCLAANRAVYAIECKNVALARNPREIQEEIEHMVGRAGQPHSWMAKHVARDRWLRSHGIALAARYGLPSAPDRLTSLFMTSIEIPTPYARNLPLPVVTFTRLEAEGVSLLESIVEGVPKSESRPRV